MTDKLTPGGFPYRQQAHRYCGSSSDRQSVGDPGHCEDCCSVGHVVAHPELGCADVGCYSDHETEIPPVDQARLGAAVKAAWGEAVAAHEQAVHDGATVRLTGGDVLEETGDAAVRTSSVRSIWDMTVEIGTATNDWHRALKMAGKLAEQILARPRSRGLVGFAVGQVRSMAMQSVLTRMDELLTEHGYDPIRTLDGQPPF